MPSSGKETAEKFCSLIIANKNLSSAKKFLLNVCKSGDFNIPKFKNDFKSEVCTCMELGTIPDFVEIFLDTLISPSRTH